MKFLLVLLAVSSAYGNVVLPATGPLCGYCKEAVQLLQQELPTVEAAIHKVADFICPFMGADQCQAAVNDVLNQVHTLLNQGTPEQLCTSVSLCGEKAITKEDLCSMVKQVYDDGHIVYWELIGVCNVLQYVNLPFTKPCVELVVSKQDKIVAATKNGIKQVVRLFPFIGLGQCKLDQAMSSPVLPAELRMFGLDAARADTNQFLCFMCQTSFEFLQQTLLSDDVMNMLVGAMQEACMNVPAGPGKDECMLTFKALGEQLIKAIRIILDKQLICQAMKACPVTGTTMPPPTTMMK